MREAIELTNPFTGISVEFSDIYARACEMKPDAGQLLIRFVRLIEQFNAFVWCFYWVLCELLEQ